MARRTPGQNDPEQVGRLIAEEYALLYEAPLADVLRAGLLRAEAAALRDREAGQPDWAAIGALLVTTLREQYHYSWTTATVEGFHLARAAATFAELKGQYEVVLPDLERAYQTATLAFPDIEPRKLRMDWRLRECDYGELTQHAKAEVDGDKPHRLTTPFPNGESYTDTAARMQSFLDDLARFHAGQMVMVIGHRATQYGLEHLIQDRPLLEAVMAPWSWQPGWTYKLNH